MVVYVTVDSDCLLPDTPPRLNVNCDVDVVILDIAIVRLIADYHTRRLGLFNCSDVGITHSWRYYAFPVNDCD